MEIEDSLELENQISLDDYLKLEESEDFYFDEQNSEKPSNGEARFSALMIVQAWQAIYKGSKKEADEAVMFFFSDEYKKWLKIYSSSTDFEAKYDFIKERVSIYYKKRKFKPKKNDPVYDMVMSYKKVISFEGDEEK